MTEPLGVRLFGREVHVEVRPCDSQAERASLVRRVRAVLARRVDHPERTQRGRYHAKPMEAGPCPR
jgi:hypothetical protein